ncbi:microtubule-associated protein tau isoform X4 [Bradysia coprophila]|nr:microtubule-associated protein tau isoform X4 [Bradysia coprophila]XP_037051188.1 microtubule-associated protein tau isoform X4 [Bradysia coprophila]
MPSQPQVQQQRFPPPTQQGAAPNQMNPQVGQPPQQQRPQGPTNPQQFQQQRPQNPIPNPNMANRGPAPQQIQSQQQPQMPQNRPPIPNTQPQSQPYQPNQQPIPQSNPIQANSQQPVQRPPFIRPQQAPTNFSTQQNNQPLPPNNQPQSQNMQPQQPVNIQPNMPYRQPLPQAVPQQRPVGPNITPARPPYGQPQTQNQPQSQQQQQQPPPPNQLRSQNSLERIQRPPDASEIVSARNEPSRPNSVLSNKSDEEYRSSAPKPSVPSVPSSYQQHPPLQRNDSRNSIPSRPQSSLEHQSKSPSPDYLVKPVDAKPGENNLPKIPENVNRNAYESQNVRDTGREIRDSVNVPRPPSVTFKEDIKKYPIESRTNEPIKSPISLNSIISSDGAVSPGYKARDTERTTTPTSEKFRAMPGLSQERPMGYVNGSDTMRLKSSLKYKGDNDSGVDETTQGNERNEPGSLNSPSKIPELSRPASATPSSKGQGKTTRSGSRSRILKTPESPLEPVKKVPMNKIQVGNAPSPNLKQVRSKIGSLENASHKPGGGNIKIETKKLEFKVTPRIEAKNEKYIPKGGEKKITHTKLQWNAKSKIGSLENANHKPGGGDKKIESVKTEFKDKAKPKVGSKDNVKHVPGGGDVKSSFDEESLYQTPRIQTQKLEIKASSKIGSLDNVKHKPGGGDKKIFDDKDYLKNVEHPIPPLQPSQQQWPFSSSLTSSMSLPAECIVLSVTSASPRRKVRRLSSGSTKNGRAWHPRPFKLY